MEGLTKGLLNGGPRLVRRVGGSADHAEHSAAPGPEMGEQLAGDENGSPGIVEGPVDVGRGALSDRHSLARA